MPTSALVGLPCDLSCLQTEGHSDHTQPPIPAWPV
jgi:hypothetical protein